MIPMKLMIRMSVLEKICNQSFVTSIEISQMTRHFRCLSHFTYLFVLIWVYDGRFGHMVCFRLELLSGSLHCQCMLINMFCAIFFCHLSTLPIFQIQNARLVLNNGVIKMPKRRKSDCMIQFSIEYLLCGLFSLMWHFDCPLQVFYVLSQIVVFDASSLKLIILLGRGRSQ